MKRKTGRRRSSIPADIVSLLPLTFVWTKMKVTGSVKNDFRLDENKSQRLSSGRNQKSKEVRVLEYS